MKLEDVVPWGRSKAEYVRMFALTDEDLSGSILDCAGGPSSFNAEARMHAMSLFLEDFPTGKEDGRYVVAELPALPFESGEFDLALCSHFLFTYSSQLSEAFHLASVLEMCRVAGEARVFPLLTSSVHRELGVGERSPHLAPVLDGLKRHGYDARVERVPYEFQKGGNEMLRVTPS